MKKKKSTKKQPSTHSLTICNHCRIRLVVPKEKASKCYLCGSVDISATSWK